MNEPIVAVEGLVKRYEDMAAVVLDILSQTENLQVETRYDEETARQLVVVGKQAGAMVIPSDFSAAILSGQPTALELVVAPGGQTAPLLDGMVVLYGAVCFGVGLKLFRFKEA